jgi:outer membrane protein TolC
MFPRYLLSLALVWPALSLAEPLALDEAVRLAQSAQPLLESQQAVARADEERSVAEAQLPDPRLKLGLVNVPYSPFSLTRESMTQAMVSVEQMFPGGDKRRLRGEVAQAGAAQKSAETAVIARSIRRDAALAWLDAWYPQRAQERFAALQNEYQYQIESERIRLASGRGEQRDVLAAQIQLDLLQDRASEFAAQAARARAELARWIGDAAQRELVQTLPVTKNTVDVQTLTAHPQIAALDKSIATLEKEASLAREAVKPDWSMEVGYGARGAGQSDMLSVQFGIELPVAQAKRQDRQLAARLAELDAMRAQREDRLRVLQSGLQAALAERQSLQARIARFEQSILPVTAQRTEATLVSYRNGKAELAAVLETRRAELDTGLQLLALQVAEAKAAVQLEYFAQETTGQGDQP